MIDAALSWALSATIAFLAVIGALFLYNLVMAPSRLQREADERGDALASKLDRVRNKQNHKQNSATKVLCARTCASRDVDAAS